MKKKMGRIMMAVAAAAAIALTGCGGNKGATETKPAGESGAASAEGSYTIGIGQFAEHGSLDNCRIGFLQGLAAEGIVEGENLTVSYDNANADGSTAAQINQSYVGKNADLICAIATPMAQAAYAAARNTEIPIIYTAVTDPVAAELAAEDGTPVGNISGTSDKLPIAEQLEMIRAILPEAKTLGIMFTTSEVNSESSVQEYEALAGEYGFEIYAMGVSGSADIPIAADTMLADCDAVTMITDNTVVASLPVILAKAEEKKIPVFGSEIEQVKKGCLAAMGLDYVALGEQTGKMAAKILKGEAKASGLKFELIEGASFYGNTAAADKLGLALPETLTGSAAELFDTITE